MPARFLIATDSRVVAATSKNQLTAYLQGTGFQVWHWLDDLWLITDAPDELTPQGFAKAIETVIPALLVNSFIVFKLEGSPPYFGRAPQEAWTWMLTHWGPPG